VLQSCRYIQTILGDIDDASDDFRNLKTEVTLFELRVEGLERILCDLTISGIPDGQTAAVKVALNSAEEAISDLLNFIVKHEKSESKWGKIRFAFAKDKCAKHSSRMGKAKGYISAVQADLTL
jgi:hypothetical protein